jgi:hypothetical protein
MLSHVLVPANMSDRISLPRTGCFAVPFERDKKFIGREDIITEIGRQFEARSHVALAGIGGVGWVCLVIRFDISLTLPIQEIPGRN